MISRFVLFAGRRASASDWFSFQPAMTVSSRRRAQQHHAS
jgi:hypothetical protein